MNKKTTILTLAAAMLTAITLNAGSRAYELSTRGNVGTSYNKIVGGVIVGEPPADRPCEDGGPNGNRPIMFAVRAVHPDASVPNQLVDPVLEFYTSDGTLQFSQDSFEECTPEQLTLLALYGLIPASDNECATIVALSPGSYTAVVSGKDQTEGVILLEIYKLSQ